MCAHHDFVQNTPSRVRHLVKLIDTTYTAVAQHKGATVRADGETSSVNSEGKKYTSPGPIASSPDHG